MDKKPLHFAPIEPLVNFPTETLLESIWSTIDLDSLPPNVLEALHRLEKSL